MIPRPCVPAFALLAGAVFVTSAASAQYPSVPPPPPCHVVSSASKRAPSRSPAARSIGVVLFQNTATDPDDVFLGPSLGVRIIEDLLAEGPLSVVASRRFGYETVAAPVGAKAVGRSLGVRYILAAQVGRLESGEVSIAAQIRKSSDGTVIWTLSKTAAVRDLPALIAEVSRGVVGAVTESKPSTGATAARLAEWSNPPVDATVTHFLRGKYYTSLNTPPGYEAALAQFDSASRSDPGFAKGFASSALTIATMLEWGWWDYGESRVRALTERGLGAADRALQLDSTSADAWRARGALLSFQNPKTYSGAFSAYTRALAYAPRDPTVHHWYGRALMQVGDRSAARRELTKALALAPGNADVIFDLARLDRHEGRPSEACVLLDSAIASTPTAAQAYVLRALTRAQRGELRFAWADAETGGRLGWPLWGRAASAAIDAKARDTASARERSAALRKAVNTSGSSPTQWTGEYLAVALVASGESERALDVLERAQPRGARLWFAITGPDFAPLRKSQRFRKLVAESHPRR